MEFQIYRSISYFLHDVLKLRMKLEARVKLGFRLCLHFSILSPPPSSPRQEQKSDQFNRFIPKKKSRTLANYSGSQKFRFLFGLMTALKPNTIENQNQKEKTELISDK